MTGKHFNLKNCVSRQQIYQEIDKVSMYYGKENAFFSRMTLSVVAWNLLRAGHFS